MSLTNVLANKAFHAAAEFEKKCFEKSKMPLLASRRFINQKTIHAHDKTYQLLNLGLLILMLAPSFIGADPGNIRSTSDTVHALVSLAATLYAASVFLLYILDLNTVECYLKNYKTSHYYYATREQWKSIPKDAGLIGEYKGYVLSRMLKGPHKTLHNVCIPMRNGSFQEIDTVIVTPNAIYVIECKNRGGVFTGSYDAERWIQYIGKNAHETENIYLQNQKHVTVLQEYLLEQEIANLHNVSCKNVVLTTGNMKLPSGKEPANFVWGDMKKIRRFIQRNSSKTESVDDRTMNAIYEALLPYALYTKEEREYMMDLRTVKQERNAFTHQMLNPDQISNGVSKERVEEYKRLTQNPEARLMLDRCVKICCAVTFFFILACAR